MHQPRVHRFLELLLFLFFVRASAGLTVEDKIREDTDLSQFYALLENNDVANMTLQLKQVSVFAPINEAFQKRGVDKHDDFHLVLYHMGTLAKTTDQLGDLTYLNSELDGNPPLWITHRVGTYHNDIYVNNARLLLNQSNFKSKKKDKEQVLHKIDEILTPVVSIPTASNPLYNPTAWEFLHQFESLNIHPHQLRVFRSRVISEKKDYIFKNEGGHTYFIPVDEGFGNSKSELIDGKVIDGHVIPREVLFTAPTPREYPYKTLAFEDNLKVVITFSEEKNGLATTVYVKSNTLVGDNRHTPGVVLAEIVKANIPVKNGVVHLIHKSLMVVDTNVKQFLEFKFKDKEDGPLSKFYWTIKDLGVEGETFLSVLEHSTDVTLFAPNNAAWEDGNLKNLIRDPQRMKEILNLHLVPGQRLSVENIVERNRKQVYQAPTMSKKKSLYFNVATIGSNRILTVEGGGVNATVVQENIASTNGIIHIIDRVLGVPHTNILEKLRTDPMLNETYFLGNRQGFNLQLNDSTRKFTYFVPRDKAWADARVQLPSAVKRLFMTQFTYHATQLLERHLVVSDIPYTMERIKQLSNANGSYGSSKNREVELPSQGGSLRLYVEEQSPQTFIIHWKGERIPVFRPNVECTNGVIHVVDKPFLREGDIRVSGANSLKLALVAPHLLMVLVAKWLLL